MGSQLVRHALNPELAKTLSPRARLALIAMCHMSYDEVKPGRRKGAAEYDGGYAGVAYALTGIPGPPDNTARTTAKRALKELTNAGLIEQISSGGWQGPAVYAILVGGMWQPPLVDN